MKQFYILLLLAALSCPIRAQSVYNVPFSLSDSTFIIGSVYTARIELTADHRDVAEQSKPSLDSIAAFIISRPQLVLELGAHTDLRGNDSSNLVLSQLRAEKIKKYLVSKGVPSQVLPAVGYGETKPLMMQGNIDRVKDAAQQEALHQRNHRCEFRILYLYRNGVFSLTDTAFATGAIMRLNVLFDLRAPTVRPESNALIDSLARFLIAHPKLKVEIGNHTDTRGSDNMNNRNSLERAQSIAERLRTQGVPESQVFVKGYGATQTLVSKKYLFELKSRSSHEQFHQLNKRTEVKIISNGK